MSFPTSKNTHIIKCISYYIASRSGLPSISRISRRKLARPRRNELQYHRGVRLPTCFGLLSSCCVQFSLLISSGCQQWPMIFMQHDLRLHIICWPYTSLHRIAYKVLSSPSQRRRAQNKSAKQPETVWLKRTDCPICPILHLGSFALQSGAVASELRDPWDCRRPQTQVLNWTTLTTSHHRLFDKQEKVFG